MTTPYDFKKEWDKTKKQLVKIGQESLKVAKKGEEEFVKLSHRGKLHLDSTAASLKREQLYYLIGKEYVKAKQPEKPTPQLSQLLDDLEKVNKEQRALTNKLKTAK